MNGNRNVAYLWNDDNGRNLNLNWIDNDWNDNYRFLAVRKSLHVFSTILTLWVRIVLSFASGVDFLGWLHFPHHRVPRTKTKKRMQKRITSHPSSETLQSYLGLLDHGDTFELQQRLLNDHWFWREERDY